MSTSRAAAVSGELSALLGSGAVLAGDRGDARGYLADATESRAIRGRADAIALPRDATEVAAVLRWCYEHDVPLTPRGGGTGFAGGAVPLDGGVVVSLERLAGPAEIEPGLWRAWVPAGARTADLRRRARENGLLFAPDPGASESSMLGGNIATNAGGPHTFKYGVTGTWVTGLEVALAPGELVRIGGQARKDVAGYDLKSLLIGSEGTLGIVTGAWLKLLPAPQAALPVVGLYRDAEAGCDALEAVLASGVVPAALEFLDAGALGASLGALQSVAPALKAGATDHATFMLIAEADGGIEEAAADARELAGVLADGAVAVHAPAERREIAELWRWREGVSLAVTAQRGGKISEDIVVPVERLREVVAATVEIGERHRLPACSWGHAGDGNVHATFMIDPDDEHELDRATDAAHQLFELAAAAGGSVSGEHGLGLVKNGTLALQWPSRALDLHEQIKRLFDPKGLLNPGKKLAR
ncbi:MAG TPA: FAD-linked oxidase C-terminal domain-containing protein [Solirubrobacteraceae bacterium]